MQQGSMYEKLQSESESESDQVPAVAFERSFHAVAQSGCSSFHRGVQLYQCCSAS